METGLAKIHPFWNIGGQRDIEDKISNFRSIKFPSRLRSFFYKIQPVFSLFSPVHSILTAGSPRSLPPHSSYLPTDMSDLLFEDRLGIDELISEAARCIHSTSVNNHWFYCLEKRSITLQSKGFRLSSHRAIHCSHFECKTHGPVLICAHVLDPCCTLPNNPNCLYLAITCIIDRLLEPNTPFGSNFSVQNSAS
jgi:hypothetical protein